MYCFDGETSLFTYDLENPFFVKENIEYKSYFPDGIREANKIFKNIYNFFVFIFSIFKSDLIIIG